MDQSIAAIIDSPVKMRELFKLLAVFLYAAGEDEGDIFYHVESSLDSYKEREKEMFGYVRGR